MKRFPVKNQKYKKKWKQQMPSTEFFCLSVMPLSSCCVKQTVIKLIFLNLSFVLLQTTRKACITKTYVQGKCWVSKMLPGDSKSKTLNKSDFIRKQVNASESSDPFYWTGCEQQSCLPHYDVLTLIPAHWVTGEETLPEATDDAQESNTSLDLCWMQLVFFTLKPSIQF